MNRDEAIERAARAVWSSFQEFQLPYNGREWESLIGLRDALELPPSPVSEEQRGASRAGAASAGRGS